MSENKYKELSNEDLAMLAKTDDEAFTEIFNRVDKMRYTFVTKNLKYNILDIDDILELCNIGILMAVNKFDKSKGLKFTTVCYRYMQTKIKHEYTFLNSTKRKETVKNTISIYSRFNGLCNNEKDLITMLENESEKDIYFKNEIVDMKKAVEFGLSMINQELRPYIVPILIGDYTAKDIYEKLGRSRQFLEYNIKNFKKHFKTYVESQNLEISY